MTQLPIDARGDAALLAARLLIAPLYPVSGSGKLADISGTTGLLADMGFPLAIAAALGAIALELGGAIALVVGLLTRTSAAALLIFTILTALLFRDFWAAGASEYGRQLTQFLKNAGLVGGLGLVCWLGSGRYAMDGALSRRTA